MRCATHALEDEFEKIWKRVKGWVYFVLLLKKGGLCIKGVSKIKRVGSDIVHQCNNYYFILSKIYVKITFNYVEIL